MRIGIAFVAAGLLVSCTNLPDLQTGVCGNHVVDPAEDCDSPEASCGPPDSAHACRNVCAAGVPCPSGSFCGTDGLCRSPSPAQTYHLTAAVGDPAAEFQVVSINGQVFLAERAPQRIILYQNQNGRFIPIGAGPLSSPLWPSDPPVQHKQDQGIHLAQLPADANPSMSVLTNVGTDLLSFNQTSLRPMVVAASALPNPGQALVYKGTVVFDPTGVAEPLFHDTTANALVAYDVSGDPVLDATIPLSGCGTALNALSVGERRRPSDTSLVAMIMDQAKVCAVVGDTTRPLPLVTLAVPALPNATLGGLALVDLDGDEQLDVTVIATDGTGAQERVFWLQTAPGVFAPGVVAPTFADLTAFPSFGAFALGDLDGDHRDDFYGTDPGGFEQILLADQLDDPNAGALGPSTPFDTKLSFYSTVFAAGDIDRNGSNDLIVSDGTSNFATCLTQPLAGDFRLSCVVQRSGLLHVTRLLVGDVDGDLTNDVVAVYGPAADSADAGGVAILPGKALGFPDEAPTVISGYHSIVQDAALAPPGIGLIAHGILATVRLDDGTFGFNLAQANGRQLAFGINPTDTHDAALFDANGDGVLDLVLATNQGETILVGRPQGGFDPVRINRALPSGVSGTSPGFFEVAGASEPVIAWAIDQPASSPDASPCPNGRACVFVARPGDGSFDVSVALLDEGLLFDSIIGPTTAELGTDTYNWADWIREDIDGDGFPELVGAAVAPDGLRHLMAAHFGAAGEPQISELMTLPRDASTFYFASLSNGAQALFIAYGSAHVQMIVRKDGRFNPADAVVDPPLLPEQPDGKLPPDWMVVGHADLNADGITDLVFVAPDGVHGAIADVVKP